MSELTIRPRLDDDLDALERIARAVYTTDGYPVYLPDGDLRGFVASPDALSAWVATRDDAVVGHVALHPSSSAPVMALATSATGAAETGFAVVARLLVDPDSRREGIARRLLDAAVCDARARDRVPVLDVMRAHRSAIALYESCGWKLLGDVTVMLPTGPTDELVYLAPPAP